jgi:hypothetical protein
MSTLDRRSAAVLLMLLALGATAGACGRTAEPVRRDPTGDSTHAEGRAATPAEAPIDTTPPTYTFRPIPTAAALAGLRRELGDTTAFAWVLKLNRIDLAHARRGDTLWLPDRTDLLRDSFALSPFPRRLAIADSLPKLLLISLRVQAFAAYEHGNLERWGPTSTGRESLPTPAALYHTNWKARQRTSTFNDEWLLKWYLNLENYLGISLHLYDLPGHPASHSCVRLALDDAMWLYDWCDTWLLSGDGRKVERHGTPVLAFGAYAYGRRAPWRNLAADPRATRLATAEIEAALRPYLLPSGGIADSLAMDRADTWTPPPGIAPSDSGSAPTAARASNRRRASARAFTAF